MQALIDFEFDFEVTGFSLAEVDFALDDAADADPDGRDTADDAVTMVSGPAVSVQGDLWLLGRHRLVCGDARSSSDFDALMDGAKADLVFTDPPYNVKIDGNVCGLGTVKHREFAFASGEMSRKQFIGFLSETLGNVASAMRDGAIAYVCMYVWTGATWGSYWLQERRRSPNLKTSLSGTRPMVGWAHSTAEA